MKMSGLYEKWKPALFSIGAGAIWYLLGKPFPLFADGLLGASATVASVLASFLGVSKAILLSIKGSRAFKILEKIGATDRLFRYLKAGIDSSIAFAFTSIFGFFIDKDWILINHHISVLYHLAWVLIGVYSLMAYLRISSILFNILKQASVSQST